MTPPLDDKLVRASFGAAVDTYESASVLQREVESRLLERLDLVKFSPLRVLDLGAGLGHGARELAARFPDAVIHALDVALPMLRATSPRLGWRRRLQRICGDARALPLTDDSVDLVWSNLALQWVDEPVDAFREITRVLRPDGLILFTSFGPDTLTELRQSWARVDDGVHVNRFLDMHDVGDALVRCGLREPVMDVEHLTLTYREVTDLMRELKNMGAHNVAEERRRSLTGKERLRGMIDAYDQAFRDDDRVPATWEVIYGLAWGPAAGQARPTEDGQIATFSVDQLRGSRAPQE